MTFCHGEVTPGHGEVATAHILTSLGSTAPSVGSLAFSWDVAFLGRGGGSDLSVCLFSF